MDDKQDLPRRQRAAATCFLEDIVSAEIQLAPTFHEAGKKSLRTRTASRLWEGILGTR